MSDPRRQRAAQLREKVLEELAGEPHEFGALHRQVKRSILAPVTQSQLESALASLRKAGRIVYRRPCWERVP
jgi:hypothetical protein